MKIQRKLKKIHMRRTKRQLRMLGISFVFSDILAILVMVLKFSIALVEAFDANSKKNFEESIKRTVTIKTPQFSLV